MKHSLVDPNECGPLLANATVIACKFLYLYMCVCMCVQCALYSMQLPVGVGLAVAGVGVSVLCGFAREADECLARAIHVAQDVAHEALDARRAVQHLHASRVRVVAHAERTRDGARERAAAAVRWASGSKGARRLGSNRGEARTPHLFSGLLETLRVEVALLEAGDEALLGGHQLRHERLHLCRLTQRVLHNRNVGTQ